MKIRNLFFCLFLPLLAAASLKVGIGQADITPPVGTPSAGYADRKGEGMVGTHDPLLALALIIDNGEKQIALCSVDHLGFTYEMVQAVMERVHQRLPHCEIYIASSHSHSGGGAYLNIPVLGESLAGPYNKEIANFYIEQTVAAIIGASQNQIPAKVGIGYGKTGHLSQYRSNWPLSISPLQDVAVIKVTKLDGSPFAVLFNYPVHPTVLKSQNRLFSSDFVGYARDHLQSILGETVQPMFLNGAQGDINPTVFDEKDRFASCDRLAQSLAETVKKIWDDTDTADVVEITTEKEIYTFTPQATPFGLRLPLENYKSEINLLVFNREHAFVTIPGELSCIYDRQLKEVGTQLGFTHVSVLGLTNDAHGYIILPESWEHKTYESALSFGGKNYGEWVKAKAISLMQSVDLH